MIVCKDTMIIKFINNSLWVNGVRIKNVHASDACSNRNLAFDAETTDTFLYCFARQKDGVIYLTPDNEWRNTNIDGYIRFGADMLTRVETAALLREALA